MAKPAGITSHDIVAQVRRAPRSRAKVGHAGTLDPFATGLLMVLVGQGDALAALPGGLPKAYRVRARFGAMSDTGDPTGELSVTGARTGEDAVRAGPASRSGARSSSACRAFSAVKVGGERLYKQGARAARSSSSRADRCGSTGWT